MLYLDDRVGIGIFANGLLTVTRQPPRDGQPLPGQVFGRIQESVDNREETDTVSAIGFRFGIVEQRAAEYRNLGAEGTVGHRQYLAAPTYRLTDRL